MATPPQESVSLRRTLGPVLVTFYGLGTIIGAGIYVLLGSVAGMAGSWMPFSFLLAGTIAAFTALSYAELSSRLPMCAGAALYVHEAWWNKSLSTVVGWLLVLTGIVSAATIANGFVGYLNVFVSMDAALAIALLVLGMGVLACWGIKESAVIIFGVTTVEVCGLIIVVLFASAAEPAEVITVTTTHGNGIISGIVLGSFIAFYAFIGFEDMVNIVEEVKNPQRNMPLGIILSVALSILLYMLVAFAAMHVMSAADLAASDAPLADMMKISGGSETLITLIGLVAVVNGALVQIIMASRVLYGMAGKDMAPDVLGSINPATKTPIVATVLVAALVLVFALALPLTQLAQITSFSMLVIFILVNSALFVIKQRSYKDYEGINLPTSIPVLGAITASLLVLYQALVFVGLF